MKGRLMKKSHLVSLATAGVITGAALVGGAVSAHGAMGGPGGMGMRAGSPEMRQEVLTNQAEWLGISTDQLWGELKDKDFKQVAEAHGKTEAEIEAHKEEMKSQMKQKHEEKREEHEQNITNKLKEKGFSDEQIKSIFETFESERQSKPDN